MDEQPEISLILPAYNERASIGRTINDAVAYFRSRGLSHEIIVAADGTDGTREHVRDLAASIAGLVAIGSPERLGKGRGIRHAVAVARGRIIGYADADNKTPIDEFDKFWPLLREGAPVVIGSRKIEQSKAEHPRRLIRRLGSKAFRVVIGAMMGLPGVDDTQCGFKFFHANVAKEIFRRQQIDGYMFDVEILHLASRLGHRIESVPVRWRDDGDSRSNMLAGNVRNMLDVLKIRFQTNAGTKAA